MSEASDNENEITNYLINDNAEDDPLEKQKMDFDNDLAEVKDEQAEVPRATGTLPRIQRRISIAEPEKAKPKKRQPYDNTRGHAHLGTRWTDTQTDPRGPRTAMAVCRTIMSPLSTVFAPFTTTTKATRILEFINPHNTIQYHSNSVK